MIFWMLTSIFYKLEKCSLLLKCIYTLSTVLFHKNVGANVGVTNLISYFSMFVPTKANVKLDNENIGHDQ